MAAATARACMAAALVVALVASLFFEGAAAAEGSPSVQLLRQVRSLLSRLNKPPLATIQSPDGDIIDCVDIYKQPAFDHPLLKNHTIQMRPSSYPQGGSQYNVSNTYELHPVTQIWHQNGSECPENTIPIRRTREEDVLRASSIRRFGMKEPGSIPPNLISIGEFDTTPDVLTGHQHAVANAEGANKHAEGAPVATEDMSDVQVPLNGADACAVPSEAIGPRRSTRPKKPNARVSGPDWNRIM